MRFSFVVTVTAVVVAITISPVQARFDMENPEVEEQIENFGDDNGIDGTIGGKLADFSGLIPSALLGEASPCDQSRLADKMLDFARSNLGKSDLREFTILVQNFMASEKNFDPATASPTLCGDRNLPRNAVLRGILPQIDPSRGLDGGRTAVSVNKKTLARRKCIQRGGSCAKFSTGRSIAEQMEALNFEDFKKSSA